MLRQFVSGCCRLIVGEAMLLREGVVGRRLDEKEQKEYAAPASGPEQIGVPPPSGAMRLTEAAQCSAKTRGAQLSKCF